MQSEPYHAETRATQPEPASTSLSLPLAQKMALFIRQYGHHLLYLILGMTVIGVIWFATFQPILVLPRIRLAPGFAFQDVTLSESVRSDDLRGGITLYTFTFTHCVTNQAATGCHLDRDALLDLHAEFIALKTEAVPLTLVTILLDDAPVGEEKKEKKEEKETPSFWTDQSDWHLLRGDELQTRYVVGQGFNLFYANAGEAGHTESYVAPGMVLVDGLGTIRAEYRSGRPKANILSRDIGLLQAEAVNRDGINRLGYEAAHLFVCYP